MDPKPHIPPCTSSVSSGGARWSTPASTNAWQRERYYSWQDVRRRIRKQAARRAMFFRFVTVIMVAAFGGAIAVGLAALVK